jgi:endonuclease YncB( thermonuclease family)
MLVPPRREFAHWRSALVGTLVLVPALAFADLEGRVVGVTDGDTITVLLGTRLQIKVRLTEIDAPESKQAFGQRSKQSLSDLCFDKAVRLVDQGVDRYGRTLARVYCAGKDANREQIKRGMAWVYDRYVTDRSLYADQDEARAAKRGLWSDAHPIPPWEWRRAMR